MDDIRRKLDASSMHAPELYQDAMRNALGGMHATNPQKTQFDAYLKSLCELNASITRSEHALSRKEYKQGSCCYPVSCPHATRAHLKAYHTQKKCMYVVGMVCSVCCESEPCCTGLTPFNVTPRLPAQNMKKRRTKIRLP